MGIRNRSTGRSATSTGGADPSPPGLGRRPKHRECMVARHPSSLFVSSLSGKTRKVAQPHAAVHGLARSQWLPGRHTPLSHVVIGPARTLIARAQLLLVLLHDRAGPSSR